MHNFTLDLSSLSLWFTREKIAFVKICEKDNQDLNKIRNQITVEAIIWINPNEDFSGHRGGHIVNTGGGFSSPGFSLFLYNNGIRVELQNTEKKKQFVIMELFKVVPGIMWLLLGMEISPVIS